MNITELSQTTSKTISKAVIGLGKKAAALPQAVNTLARETAALPQAMLTPVDSFVSSRRGLDENVVLSDRLRQYSNSNSRNSANSMDALALETSILVTGTQTGTMDMPSGTKTPMYKAYVWQDGKQTGEFEVSRQPYDAPHETEGRYRSYSEPPAGIYYLNPGPESHRLGISDAPGGTTIQGPVDQRSDIQFHPAVNAEGCMTFRNSNTNWSDKKIDDPFWQFKSLVNEDVKAGRARVYVQGRYNENGSVDGQAGVIRDLGIYVKFLGSPGVLNI